MKLCSVFSLILIKMNQGFTRIVLINRIYTEKGEETTVNLGLFSEKLVTEEMIPITELPKF